MYHAPTANRTEYIFNGKKGEKIVAENRLGVSIAISVIRRHSHVATKHTFIPTSDSFGPFAKRNEKKNKIANETIEKSDSRRFVRV